MKQFIRLNWLYILLSILFMAGLGWALIVYPKAEMHLWLNACHTAFLDFFFSHYTAVGEWVPYVVVVGLLFYKAGWSSFLLVDVAVSGLLAQRLKYVFNTDRPYRWFMDHCPDVQLPLVDGVTLSKWYSFPSGHTTTFFALFFTLSIVIALSGRNKHPNLWAFICFVLTILGAYSRIYLSQHFAEDILGGAIIGFFSTCLLYVLVPPLRTTAFWNWRIQKIA